jgi:hypothetical protein
MFLVSSDFYQTPQRCPLYSNHGSLFSMNLLKSPRFSLFPQPSHHFSTSPKFALLSELSTALISAIQSNRVCLSFMLLASLNFRSLFPSVLCVDMKAREFLKQQRFDFHAWRPDFPSPPSEKSSNFLFFSFSSVFIY